MPNNHVGCREIAVDDVGFVHFSNFGAYHAHYVAFRGRQLTASRTKH